MNKDYVEIQLKQAMRFTSLQWRNQARMFFERWAMITAFEHCVLLEDLSRSDAIWNWYKAQFSKVELKFYQTNKEYIHTINAPDELFEVFTVMAHEIEDYYPATLINKLNNGQTVSK